MNNPGWWGIPQLFLYTGDEEKYRTLCQQMLEHAEQSTDIMANAFTMRSCLASPKPLTDPSALAASTDRWLTASRNIPGGPNNPGFGPREAPRWRPPDSGQPPPRPPRPDHLLHYLAGLAHYRAGEMNTAIQHLKESMDVDPRWPASAIGLPVLAMAHQRLGQNDQARQTLTRADETIDDWLNQMLDSPVGSTPVPWFDLLEYLCLHREAQILITGNTPPDDARMQTLQDRALAAIGR